MKKSSFNQIINSTPLVLIDFHAEWCGPCKMLSPMLKDISSEMKDKVKVIKIDVDKNQRLAAQYQIQGVPTVMLFKHGKQVWRQAGVPPKHQIVKIINQNS